MWSGTEDQYLKLYAVVSEAIKKFDPSVKVGGFAASGPYGKMVLHFLEYCREHQLPLDFFSWHVYTTNPRMIERTAKMIRLLLNEYGFTKAESHLNEWNLWMDFHCDSAYQRREMSEKIKNEIGASFSASTLIRLQDAEVDVANYYDGQPSKLYCGLFDCYGVPMKTYRAFHAFRALLDYPLRVQTQGKGDVDSLAVFDQGRQQAVILLSRFGGKSSLDHTIVLQNLPPGMSSYDLCMVDHDHQMEIVKSGQLGMDEKIVIPLREYAVALLRLS
jgi:hypothetical protein